MVCYTGIDAESDVLYCQIGTADLRESVMTFGAPVAIGKETLGSVGLGAQGRCFVITVDAGQAYIRRGKLISGQIQWFPRTVIDQADSGAAAIDDLGRIVETHVRNKQVLYTIGS